MASSVRMLSISDRVYRALLVAYPPPFRERYAEEMAQVFRTHCWVTYRTTGARGVMQVWLATLWDWAWTAMREQLSNFAKGQNEMTTVNTFERQLGDMVWAMTTALRAGYSVKQVFEMLADDSVPEPTRGAAKKLLADLRVGRSFVEALAEMQKALPSSHLAELIGLMLKQRETGGNLADILEPFGEQIVQTKGSDKAFGAMLRQLAEKTGAPLPERLREN